MEGGREEERERDRKREHHGLMPNRLALNVEESFSVFGRRGNNSKRFKDFHMKFKDSI